MVSSMNWHKTDLRADFYLLRQPPLVNHQLRRTLGVSATLALTSTRAEYHLDKGSRKVKRVTPGSVELAVIRDTRSKKNTGHPEKCSESI